MSVLHNIVWSRDAPVVWRANGQSDKTAHHVLLALATFSDVDGRCRPSLDRLAKAALETPRTTKAALKRLLDARLIKSDGEYGSTGITVWVLMLGVTRSDVDTAVFEERQARSRKMTADRQRRFRERKRVTSPQGVTDDASQQRDVTSSESVTERGVTPSKASRNAAGKRDVTPSDDTRNAATTVTTAGQLAIRTIEEPIEEPGRTTLSPTAKRERRSEYTSEFEAFWAAYGRKGAKGAAAREWQRAIKRADRTLIMAAVGPYLASRPEARFRKDAERWLRDDCWESEVVTNGHQAYRNPTDLSEYDEELLA